MNALANIRACRFKIFRINAALFCVLANTLLILVKVHAASGQSGPTIETFSGERFAENWSSMADPAKRTRPWHRLKWLDLGHGTRLSLGSDLKWRSEYINAPLFGITDAEEDFYVLKRFMVHGDLRFSPNMRIFAQLGYHQSSGRKEFFPFDNNQTDLQQGFIELSGGEKTHGFGFRLGRQEIVLSPRFVTSRGALNQRGAFDGARLWLARGAWQLDMFATRPVANKAGAFDDSQDNDQRFDAMRLKYAFGEKRRWQATGSWHRIDRKQTTIGPLSGRDNRTSWSLRVKGVAGSWDLDIEHYQQTGRFGAHGIDAYGGGGDAGFTWSNLRWLPRLGIRWLYGSGDSDLADAESNTFFGPRARPPCCEDALWSAPSNMLVLSPVLSLRPTSRTWLDFKLDVVRRLKSADGIYAAGRIVIPNSFRRSGSDVLAVAPGLHYAWAITDEITIRSYVVSQNIEGVLVELGGRSSVFSTLSVHVKL